MAAKIVSIVNQKGGVGKTTTASTFAIGLAKRKYKVLLIDIDGQGNLTSVMKAQGKVGILEVLTDEVKIKNAIQQTEYCDFLMANGNLAHADKLMANYGKDHKLKEALEDVLNKYDYIVIDNPPALNILTINSLVASNEIIITAQADIFSFQGVALLTDTVNAVIKYTNKNLKIAGILLTRYNSRSVLTRDLTNKMEEMAKNLKTKVYKTKIRESIAIKEAQVNKEDIFTYSPKSNVAVDYNNFIEEYLKGE